MYTKVGKWAKVGDAHYGFVSAGNTRTYEVGTTVGAKGIQGKKKKEVGVMSDAVDMLKRVRSEGPVLRHVLRDFEVIMSDAMIDALSFPATQLRYRRDHAVFLDMVATVAYMRQYEKKVQMHSYADEEKMVYVLCDGRDYEIAYGLFCEYMQNDPEFTLYEDLAQITTPEAMRESLGETNSTTKPS